MRKKEKKSKFNDENIEKSIDNTQKKLYIINNRQKNIYIKALQGGNKYGSSKTSSYRVFCT